MKTPALAAVAVAVCILAPPGAQAFSTGITGVSGNPADGGNTCNLCHSGGVVPTVQITGPQSVGIGTVNSYMLTISGGQANHGGLDIDASDGTLSAIDPGTRALSGEITHNAPRAAIAGVVTFSFNWTAPAAAGTYTLYGAGNSVNFNGNTQGDRAGTTTLDITVVAASPTPGESSGPGMVPLRATGRDPLTGDITLGFESGCETTDNMIVYGQGGSPLWSGAICNVGTSGTVTGFNPPGGPGTLVYFVIVGQKGTDEGPYGSDRPPFAGNPCGTVQNLGNTCN